MEEKEVEVDPRARVAGIRNKLSPYEVTLDIDEDGGVALVGERLGELPPELWKLVERNQKMIAGHLSKCRRWRWPREGGLEWQEANPSDQPHPSRARWWKYVGESAWREVPGWVDPHKMVIGVEE